MTTSTQAGNTHTGVTTQVYCVYIKATPEAIWEAITKPEWTKQYGYGGPAEYDLRPGGAFLALTSPEMRAMGAPDEAVDGEVIEVDPPNKLVQTWRLVMDPTIKAEGFTRLTFEIAASGDGVTKLTVIHEFDNAPNAALLLSGGYEDAGQGGGGGWAWVLSDLKSLLETGKRMAG
jgi:uncharacterized protein YndB with AHSA1/START domain